MASDSVNDTRADSFRALPLLHTLPPRQIAKLIRGLDSTLVGIDYDSSGAAPVLVYSFEVAGRRERFAVPAQPDALVSIADLYPAASTHEHQLQQHYGLTFRRSDCQGDD